MAKFMLNPILKSINGRVGNIVFYTRKNIQCGRLYVIPRNPDTESQRINRNVFRDAVHAWQELPSLHKDRWNRLAHGKPLSGYNLFISYYTRKKIERKDHACNGMAKTEEAGIGYGFNPYQFRFHSVHNPYSVHEDSVIHPISRFRKDNGPPNE